MDDFLLQDNNGKQKKTHKMRYLTAALLAICFGIIGFVMFTSNVGQ